MSQRQITRQEIAYRLGITPYGLDKMLQNQTMKVSHLEKLCKFFQVPVSYWFDEYSEDKHTQTTEEPSQPLSTHEIIETMKDQISTLRDQLREKDEQIRSLLEVLKGKK